MIYTEIQIAGKLDAHWEDWFDGLEIRSQESGGTVLCGTLPDQSAVYGVITRLANLGMILIALTIQKQDEKGKE